jgi:hypothetical protein
MPLSQLRQLPGAPELEGAWLRARAGEDGYLAGTDGETAACDVQTVPVVTGSVDPGVIDNMIALAQTAGEAEGTVGTAAAPGSPLHLRSGALSPEAWQALRYAVARLAIDLVSGPARIAAILRRGLLGKPCNTRACPWTSATETPSPPASAARCCCATAPAPGPAAAAPWSTATCTTCASHAPPSPQAA